MPQITLPVTVTLNVTFDFEVAKAEGDVGLSAGATDISIDEIVGIEDPFVLSPALTSELISLASDDLHLAAMDILSNGR